MEYPQYPNGVFGDAVPRAGNASGGGQPGWAVRTKGGGPNDYIYVIIQPPGWEPLMKLCGRPEVDHRSGMGDAGKALAQARQMLRDYRAVGDDDG